MSRVGGTVRPMDTAVIRPLPSTVAPTEPSPLPTRVRIDGDRIVVERLVLGDAGLAAYLADRPGDDRPAIVERALRIGLLALQDTGVTVNVDVVKTEFERLVRQAEQVNERAAATLEQTLRTNFADGDGRLPRTLERFLGDRGALRGMVDELFDEKKRDSAIGRMSRMLETYFDGDASKLATLLDPTRLHSPMHQFREEIAAGFKGVEERLVAIEAAAAARGAERARSAAKGVDFEDLLEGDARRSRPRRRRPAGPYWHRRRGRAEVQEGRLRPDRGRAGRARLRPARRDRGQGPPDVDARDPRRAARGPREPRRRHRARRLHARPMRRPASRRSTSSATRSTASSTRRRRTRPPSRRPFAWPACSPWPR